MAAPDSIGTPRPHDNAEPKAVTEVIGGRVPQPAFTDQALATDTDYDSRTLMEPGPAITTTGSEIVIGQNVGKYEIRAALGAGGMGAVYLAFDPLIEREVALKVLGTAAATISPVAVQRFLGEARAIGRLNHPHVVSIYDIDQWNGRYFIVMELLAGGSVAGLLKGDQRLSWQDATRIVAEAARGLEAAHQAGLIHRDVKPDNLMLTLNGSVKVVDFGLSKLQDADADASQAVTKAGQILGTPQYMSPEQFESAEVDLRTDIYSLGATYFHLLTSRLPYHDCKTIMQVMSAHMTKPPPVPRQLEADLPADCDRIVVRAMSKDPAERYQSAAEFAKALEALLQASNDVGPAPAEPLEIDDRELSDVLVVEPSKLQAAMTKSAFTRVGTRTIRVAANSTEACRAVANTIPDLVMTALELPEGRGTELLRELSRQSLLRRTTAVLNSSDSTIVELVDVCDAACCILAPKKTKADEIVRLAHAVGPVVVGREPLARPIDPLAVRIRIEQASGRVPDLLTAVIRELNLLDIDVTTGGASTSSGSAAVVLVVRDAHQFPSRAAAAAVANQVANSGALAAVLEAGPGLLRLRAVCYRGAIAVCERNFGARRLVCLIQACRS